MYTYTTTYYIHIQQLSIYKYTIYHIHIRTLFVKGMLLLCITIDIITIILSMLLLLL